MSEQEVQHPPVYGGLGRRLGAFSYDLLMLSAALLVAHLILLPFTNGTAIAENDPLQLLYQLYNLAIVYMFFAWFWVHGGQTIGMRAWKIRLELESGRNLNWNQSLLRLLLGALLFGVGMIWCLWDPKRRALYDVLARTQVIRVDKGYVPDVK